MRENTVTTRGVGGVLRLDGEAELPVTVLLRHSSDEPSALRAVVVLDVDESFELVLDRALLTTGLTGPASDDHVQVAVVGREVRVTVGALTVGLALPDVIDVLLASYQAAPTGSESHTVIALTARARELSQA